MNAAAVDKSRSHQAAVYSFCGAIGVCVIVFVSWWLMQPQAPGAARQRRLTELEVQWRCPDGHAFRRKGTRHPVPCPECGRRADVSVVYHCRQHGPRPALIRYTKSPAGREIVSEISFKQMVWNQVRGALRCPECGSKMAPETSNPFALPGDETTTDR